VTLRLRKLINKYDCNITFFLGGMVAIVIFCLVYGVRVLDPQYDGWIFCGLKGVDLYQHYLGWLFYRKSEWHFPITLIDGIYYPHQVPVVFTDSIPLVAVIFKALSFVLPETFQYFGLFGALSYFLLGGFSSLILYKFTGSRVYSVIGSVFSSFSMLMLIRCYGHTALIAHWLVVASLYVMLHKEKELSIKNSCIYWSLLAFLAVGIHAYFVPMIIITMVFGIMAGVLRRETRSQSAKKLIVCMICVSAVVVFSAYVFGYFYGSGSRTGNDLGLYSFNYNSFFNTFGYSFVIGRLPFYYWGQYEGYAYLGLGIYVCLVLTIVLLVINRGKTQPLFDKEGRVSLVIYSVILIIFAGSNTVSWGDQAFRIPLPEFITSAWSIFRSSGRMIWPVFYLVTLMILAEQYRAANKKVLAVMICIMCLGLHFYENLPHILYVNERFSVHHDRDTVLTDDIWSEIADRYDHIMICSDANEIYQYGESTRECFDLAYFACEHDMTINTIILSRFEADAVNDEVEDYFSSGAATADNETVFVFLSGEPKEGYDLYYYECDGMIIGTVQPL